MSRCPVAGSAFSTPPGARRRTARCPGRPRACRQEALGPGAPSGRHGDVLPAVDAVARRAAVVAAAALELPQQLPGLGVERVELARGLAGEHEVAARGQPDEHIGMSLRQRHFSLPVRGSNALTEPGHVLEVHRDARAPVRDALLELPAPPRGGRADVLHRGVEELGLRAVGGVRPPFAPAGPGQKWTGSPSASGKTSGVTLPFSSTSPQSMRSTNGTTRTGSMLVRSRM